MNSKEKRYTSARSFSQALDEKLRAQVKNQAGYDIARIRRQVGFDCLLARLFIEEPCPPSSRISRSSFSLGKAISAETCVMRGSYEWIIQCFFDGSNWIGVIIEDG